MPFIDDDLLWCPDNDGKMVDLSSCLQVRTYSHNLKGLIHLDLARLGLIQKN